MFPLGTWISFKNEVVGSIQIKFSKFYLTGPRNVRTYTIEYNIATYTRFIKLLNSNNIIQYTINTIIRVPLFLSIV